MSSPTTTTPSPAARPESRPGQVVGATPGERLRSWRPFLAAGALLLLVALATLWTSPQSSKVPYAIDNPHSDGAQALAALLRDQGVNVTSVSSADAAISAAADGATVVVLNVGDLSDYARSQLARVGADVVVLGTLYQDLDRLADITSTGASAGADTSLEPACTDPDAVAAASLAGSAGSVSLDGAEEAVGCFPVGEDAYAYATAPLTGGGTLRVIADPRIVTNANLTTAGNAALAIRALGHHQQLVWFDASQAVSQTVWDTPMLPPWLPVLLFLGVVVVTALALVRGRRFGRLVSEDLPVVVRATETAIGRGRLYRRAGDRERAAQALRAGTALRLGRSLGLGPPAGRGELIQAAARASGWPVAEIDHALYGPTPTDDHALADLAVRLEQLESEVHQR
ncbi:MAG: DUF4350 domain-containing protein [Actinomyces ruminicola]|uniref:DUF4350 domain-containing protein n=1 Tax=Actinomyces ruminicola TaxID=332524 RepID=A0A1G9YE40_9ACTO|nr:DUF4350 domain-containing protein [Actinomyces ruminicola]MBE6480922.1 DUF4350 domain-containing protein [Actinomyces ruminicola]SDN07334.1 hypothetical protein SAMN04487766_11243 [Actinomyces ruminicola]